MVYMPTEGQQAFLSLILIPGSILSIVGSSLIIRNVRQQKTRSSYRNIMMVSSMCDIIFSAVWILQPFLSPADIPDAWIYAVGNQATCSVLGAILAHISVSIGNSIESRRKNKKPTSVLRESPASTHNNSISTRQTVSKSVQKRSQESVLTNQHTLPSVDDEENQRPLLAMNQCKRRPCSPKNSPWNLHQGDSSYDTTSTFHQSMSTHSSMLDKYAFMSYRFPITTKTKKVVLTKRPKRRDIAIETSHGEIIGCIDYNFVKEGNVRILKDVTGRPCALIQKTKHDSFLGGPVKFRVYGDKPAFFGQEPVTEEKVVRGCYLWAEIENTGAVGGNFVMKRFSSEPSFASSTEKHFAKRFGSLFSKDKSRGFTFLDSEENKCAKMFSLNNGSKGILIAPDRDMCLMLAFCAVVDEWWKTF